MIYYCNIMLWYHRRICGASLSETPLCGAYLYHKKAGGQLKCDGTCAETRFRLSAKRTSPFKSAGASAQLITGSRGVRISGSNVPK